MPRRGAVCGGCRPNLAQRTHGVGDCREIGRVLRNTVQDSRSLPHYQGTEVVLVCVPQAVIQRQIRRYIRGVGGRAGAVQPGRSRHRHRVRRFAEFSPHQIDATKVHCKAHEPKQNRHHDHQKLDRHGSGVACAAAISLALVHHAVLQNGQITRPASWRSLPSLRHSWAGSSAGTRAAWLSLPGIRVLRSAA